MIKKNLLAAVTIILFAAAFIVFIGSCWLAASDAQGAFVFILSLPLTLILLITNLFLTKQPLASEGLRITLCRLTWVSLIYILLFISGVVFSPLKVIPQKTIEITAKTFELVTGLSPYEYARK